MARLMLHAVRDPFSEILDLRRPLTVSPLIRKPIVASNQLSGPSGLTLCSSRGSCPDGEAIQGRPVPHGIQAQPWTT